MVFVSFTGAGRPARPAGAARTKPELAAKRAMTCLFVNALVLAIAIPQVNPREKGVGSGPSLGYLAPAIHIRHACKRRGGRVVDRAALEMRSTGDRTGGSNPSLSATLQVQTPRQDR